MKNLAIFLKISNKISRFFQKFLKIYRFFGANLDKNLENVETCISRGSRGEPPVASEFLDIWVEKSMETCIFE